MLLKNCGLCSKVWESRALPSNLTLIFFQSIASSRVLAYFRMFFGLSSHVSHIFLNNLKCIGSVHLPSLPASNAILLDSCFLDPHLPWLYPEVPNFVFLLESFSHPIFFFFPCTFTFCIPIFFLDPSCLCIQPNVIPIPSTFFEQDLC